MMLRECADAKEAGLEEYVRQMTALCEASASGALTLEKMFSNHIAALKLALGVFRGRAGGDNGPQFQARALEEEREPE